MKRLCNDAADLLRRNVEHVAQELLPFSPAEDLARTSQPLSAVGSRDPRDFWAYEIASHHDSQTTGSRLRAPGPSESLTLPSPLQPIDDVGFVVSCLYKFWNAVAIIYAGDASLRIPPGDPVRMQLVAFFVRAGFRFLGTTGHGIRDGKPCSVLREMLHAHPAFAVDTESGSSQHPMVNDHVEPLRKRIRRWKEARDLLALSRTSCTPESGPVRLT
ncbi:hypothetical protein GGR56DRAFT_364536 [Xylariaceae sp. FL0804]|nr:hypothetical protein GGR56DRAFT_364536 [Xylariaceae sp. FL0804]